MNDKKIRSQSIKGLANIAQLLNRADLPTTPSPAARRERRTQDDIFKRTMEKIGAATAPDLTASQAFMVKNYVQAAFREVYNLGHADALDQNNAVEELLEKQYDARTKVTMPAVAAAVMEQHGLSSMTLDLALMSTVFQRTQIDYVVTEQDVIEYTLRPVGD